VTYGQQGQLAELLGSIRPLVNNTSNKADVKQRFMKYGGLWLCAGMSVGLDLPYDTCQQMIIPNLMYPDRSDLFVQKRAGLGDGAEWYNLKTMSNLVQRLGRGVRAVDDKCKSFILDPNFGRLYLETESEFAKLNLIWSKT
jgi:Rad3-related DNA helicase